MLVWNCYLCVQWCVVFNVCLQLLFGVVRMCVRWCDSLVCSLDVFGYFRKKLLFSILFSILGWCVRQVDSVGEILQILVIRLISCGFVLNSEKSCILVGNLVRKVLKLVSVLLVCVLLVNCVSSGVLIWVKICCVWFECSVGQVCQLLISVFVVEDSCGCGF